jgi:hypothetical protein
MGEDPYNKWLGIEVKLEPRIPPTDYYLATITNAISDEKIHWLHRKYRESSLCGAPPGEDRYNTKLPRDVETIIAALSEDFCQICKEETEQALTDSVDIEERNRIWRKMYDNAMDAETFSKTIQDELRTHVFSIHIFLVMGSRFPDDVAFDLAFHVLLGEIGLDEVESMDISEANEYLSNYWNA